MDLRLAVLWLAGAVRSARYPKRPATVKKSTKDAVKLAVLLLAITAVIRLVAPHIPVVGPKVAGAV